MNSKKRVLLALEHREPDLVPIDFWATTEVKKRLIKHWSLETEEDLLELIGCDIRMLRGPAYPKLQLPDGTNIDHWGVKRLMVSYGKGDGKGTYAEVIEAPLKDKTSVHEIEMYDGWPSANWVDDYLGNSKIESIAPEVQNKYAVVFTPDRLDRTAQLKPALYLRGAEEIFTDMIEFPAQAEAIFNRIADYYLDFNARVFSFYRGQADIFLMGDDFGMQTNLLISPAMWRKYFRNNFKKFIDLAHGYGFKVMHHTCGAVRDLIPDFIECGLDILQSLQPNAQGMDLKSLKSEFGKYISFHGSICIQKVLPLGSAKEVDEMVRRQISIGKKGGGFILCTSHNIQNDTPLDNLEALIDAYKTYR